MIAWSIEAALGSGCFDEIIVSTDDSEIAEIAVNYGASVPFKRSTALSNDFATTGEVMQDAVKNLLKLKDNIPDYCCCIYATAPLIDTKAIQQGLETIKNCDYSYVFAVTSYAFPIQRALRINPNGTVQMIDEHHKNSRSQDLEEAFHDAGQFYWGKTEAWLNNQSIFDSNSYGLKLPRCLVQDIDNNEDWYNAELIFETHKLKRDS